MMGFWSVVIGIVCLLGTVVTLIPCLAGLYWVVIPFAVVGAVLGILSVFTGSDGGTRTSILGTAICMATAILGIVRLVIAGGFQ